MNAGTLSLFSLQKRNRNSKFTKNHKTIHTQHLYIHTNESLWRICRCLSLNIIRKKKIYKHCTHETYRCIDNKKCIDIIRDERWNSLSLIQKRNRNSKFTKNHKTLHTHLYIHIHEPLRRICCLSLNIIWDRYDKKEKYINIVRIRCIDVLTYDIVDVQASLDKCPTILRDKLH